MFGSFSSYSSMSTVNMTTPIDISASTAGSTVCAFPSWPRRSYLDDHNSSASSYLSDEDLFLDDFDSCARGSFSSSSRSSSNASSISPPADWRQAQEPFVAQVQQAEPTEEEYREIQRQRQAYQRELVRSVLKEKESRKQARRQRRAAAGTAAAPTATTSKKSNKLSAIAEDA